MPGPPLAATGLHGTLNAAMSAASRDAMSRHAFHHGPPYPKQLQQPSPSSRNRSNSALIPPPPASSSDEPTNSTYPGSPWTPPHTDPDIVDLSLGQPAVDWDPRNQPSSTGYGSMVSDSDAVGDEGSGPHASATDGGRDYMTANGGGELSGDGVALGEQQTEGEAVDYGGGGVEVVDDGASWSSRYFSSRDPTFDGVIVAAEGSSASDAAGIITVSVYGVLPRGQMEIDGEISQVIPHMAAGDAAATRTALAAQPAASPASNLVVGLLRPPGPNRDATAAAAAAVTAAGPTAHSSSALPPQAATRSAAIHGTGGRVHDVDVGKSGVAVSNVAPSPDLAAVPSGVSIGLPSISSSMSVGITGVSLLPRGSAHSGYLGSSPTPVPGVRVSRPSWAGSHDSSPPSTSGSASGALAASAGMLQATNNTTRGGGGGEGGGGAVGGGNSSVRRNAVSAPEWSFHSGSASAGGSLSTAGMLGVGLVGSSVVMTGTGQALAVQNSLTIPERGAATKIQIEVNLGGLGLELNIKGRGRPSGAAVAAAAASGGGKNSSPRRGRVAQATTGPPAGVSFGQQDGISSSSSLGSIPTVPTSRSIQSSALWSSARRLRLSLHRLHQQYQNYHALQGDPGTMALQSERSSRGGTQALRPEGSSAAGAVPRLVISGHGHEAAAEMTYRTPMATGGRESHSRRPAGTRPLSAPSSRPPLGMSGLRMQPDTHLQLDRETSRGRVHAVASALTMEELDKAWDSRWTHDDGGRATARSFRSAKSLPVSPRHGRGRPFGSVRRARSAGGGTEMAAAAAYSPRSGGAGSSPMASPRMTAAGATAAPQAMRPRSPPTPSRTQRRLSAHPVLIMPSMAVTTAAEDPDLIQVLDKARRRAAIEKQKLRAAREISNSAVDTSSSSCSSARHLVGISALRTAAEKGKAADLLFQRQAEEWARTHRQMPPRRRLAPSVTKMVEKWFSLVDDDGSGHLETKELAIALQMAGVPCTENDVLGLVSTIDVNRDGAVSLSEFLNFLLKELGAGKNLTSGDYLLPSGGPLPFAAMIARLKRLRVLDDVMKGGKARNRYVDMLYNRDALAAEIGLSEQVAASLQARAVPADASNGEDPPDPLMGGGRRGGRVRLQQLFQQYRQAQRSTSGGDEQAATGAPGASAVSAAAPEPSDLDWNLERSGIFGAEELRHAPGEAGQRDAGAQCESRALGAGAAVGVKLDPHARDPQFTACDTNNDSDYDAMVAGFGEKVSGVSYYPRHSTEVSVLQGACASQRASADGVVVLPHGEFPAAPGADPTKFFQLTEVLLPLAEASARNGTERHDGDEEAQDGMVGEPSEFPTEAARVESAVAQPMLPRLLLPVISPLPPVKRPSTRAFKRALHDVRHSAPEYLMQRFGLPGPLEAAAAAVATAGAMSPHSDRPRGRRRTVGEGRGGGRRGSAAAAVATSTAIGHATESFRPVASNVPDALLAHGELSAASVTVLTAASDPVTASTTATKVAAAAAGAYYTTYGAGFSRYKRWSMYDIDPASENPDYWQAKAAALLMRRTSRVVRGVPGAGVAATSAAAAAAVAVIAAADAAKDIELCPATAAAMPQEGTGNSSSSSEKQILPPSAPKQRRQRQPTSKQLQGNGTGAGWHLPSLQAGTLAAGGGGTGEVSSAGNAAATATIVPRVASHLHPSAPVAMGASAAAVVPAVTFPSSAPAATTGRAAVSPWRRGPEEPVTPGSPTRHTGRGGGTYSRGFGACALGRGSAAAAMLQSPRGPSASTAATGGIGGGAGNSPVQYVIRPQHGGNPRLAAEALRRRRPLPSPVLEMDPLMQGLLSKSTSRSPHRSPSRSPQLSPQRSLHSSSPRSPSRSVQSASPQSHSPAGLRSPQAQVMHAQPPVQRRSPALPNVTGTQSH